MRNPFKTPLKLSSAPVSTADEFGNPGTQKIAPHSTDGIGTASYAGPIAQNPVAIGSDAGDVFQDTNPAYAGKFVPKHLNNPGLLPTFQELNPSGNSRSLTAPRTEGEYAATNTFYMPEGPVSGQSVSSSWSGQNTALRAPVAAQSGPVAGGRSSGEQASLSYFASVAQQASQDAIARALVTNV
jgi:hypothetical protein